MGGRSSGETIVSLEDVGKSYRAGEIEVPALRNATLQVVRGQFLAILGPSGSGKTTLLNLIGGIDSPSSGRIVVDGLDITHFNSSQLTNYRRTKIGFVFQFFNLIPTLTAKENVEFAAELVENPFDPLEILDEVGLRHRADHFPSELSGGEQQRVAVARALVTDPPIVLCDEPTGNLDFDTGKRILKLMYRVRLERSKTFIIVTHNAEIGKMANRVVRIKDGTIAGIVDNAQPLDADELSW